MANTKNNFARVTLWTECLKLQTEGHTVPVIAQLFDHLTAGQRQAVFDKLNLTSLMTTELALLQHEIAERFFHDGPDELFATKMKSLFLLQALSIASKSSAETILCVDMHDVVERLDNTRMLKPTQLALMSIGVSHQSDKFSDEERELVSASLQYIKDALFGGTQNT